MKIKYIAPHSNVIRISPESHILSVSGGDENLNYGNYYSGNGATQQFSDKRGGSTLWADMEE